MNWDGFWAINIGCPLKAYGAAMTPGNSKWVDQTNSAQKNHKTMFTFKVQLGNVLNMVNSFHPKLGPIIYTFFL